MKVIAWNKKLGWHTGEFNPEKMKIGKRQKINKLSDAKTDTFVTCKRYLQLNEIDITEESFCGSLKVGRLYINMEVSEEKEDTETETRFEKKWWAKFNKFCIGCTKECKQSSHMTIIKCPSYEKIAA